MNTSSFLVSFKNCDSAELELTSDGNGLLSDFSLKCIGCFDFIYAIGNLRLWLKSKVGSSLTNIDKNELFRLYTPADAGSSNLFSTANSHSKFLFFELCLKLAGKWSPPFIEEEICHCRVISTKEVVNAIYAGGSKASLISKWTSAGTACGTCRTDIDQMISYIESFEK